MKNKMTTLFCLLIYKISYEVIYANVSSRIFSYSGLTWHPVLWKFVFSYVLFFCLALLPERKGTVTKYLLNIYFVFTIIPMLSLFWQSDRSVNYILMCATCYFVMHMGCYVRNTKKAKKIIIGYLLEKVNISSILIAITITLIMLFSIRYGVADFRALDLENVYSVRSERKFSGIWGYMINWMPYAIVPCIMCIGLYRKKIIQICIAIMIQLYLFLFTGSKTTLFSIALILFSYYLVANKKNFINWWSMALVGLNSITTFIYLWIGELMPFAIFPIRLLTIPASISNNHYDFFSNNPKLYFAENIIGRLFGIESPYDTFSTYLVSTGSGNANTGLLGDAYDNGGFFVMLLYAVIFVLIFRYIERIYNLYKGDTKVLPVFVGVLTYSMIYLNDGSLTALLITGGLVINIFVLMQFGKRKREWERLE